MVYINNFTHRLANQLFQIACAIGVAEKHNSEYIIPEWNYNQYLKNPVNSSIEPQVFSYIFKEDGFSYQEIPFKENMAIEGYFQSERYFEHCKDKIRKMFQPKDEIVNVLKEKYGNIINSDSICSIHIRRGDYLNHPNHHPIVSPRYCKNAIKKFPDNFKIVVFSDDIPWCKDVFRGDEFIFIEGQSDIEDFYMMALCKNNIIANSSFSWWAAWLNDNPNKIVCAPSKWFGPAYAHFDTKDLIPENWNII